MDMNIGQVSMGLSMSGNLSEVGTALLAKSLDQAEVSGAKMVEMIDSASMERSVNPNVGGNIDFYA